MARKLSAQDKLALALTSAGSMRELARRVGVTHQRIGRWLREGEAGGVSSIPKDFFTQAAIDEVFKVHKAEVSKRARADKVPFLKTAPVMLERKARSDGTAGDRVVAANTEFIRPELRRDVFQKAIDSQRFYSGSVRSVVTLRTYFRGRAAEELSSGERHRRITERDLANAMMRDWLKREAFKGRVIDPEQPFPLYTRAEGLRITPGDDTSVKGIERQLRQKHEPATGKPGTVASDQFLFQLTPKDYEPPPHKNPRGRSRPQRRRHADQLARERKR